MSKEEKIAAYIVSSCSIGEIKDLMEDLKKVVTLEDSYSLGLVQKHLEEHSALVQDEEKTKYIVSELTRLPSEETKEAGQASAAYADYQLKKRVLVDLASGKVTETQPLEISAQQQAYNEEMGPLTEKYMGAYYKPDNSKSAIVVKADRLDLLITSKNIQLKNLYTGEWITRLTTTKEGTTGSIRINAHCFEEGNVQFVRELPIEEKEVVLTGNPKEDGKSIMKLVEEKENSAKESIEEFFLGIKDEVIKNLRRALPITGQKIDWNVHLKKCRDQLYGKKN